MKTILGSIWKWICVVATISSILGLFLSFLSDDKSVKVALFVFCVVLIVILIGVILTLNRLIKQNFPEPYEKISSFYEFKSDDGKAEPFISTRLDSPIKIMQYKVLLSYKDDTFSEDAVFERKPIDADVDSGWEYLDSIPFESKYKQYQYVIVAPEPGYIYKIRWIK